MFATHILRAVYQPLCAGEGDCLLTFPEDVNLLIFGFLDELSLVRVRQVSVSVIPIPLDPPCPRDLTAVSLQPLGAVEGASSEVMDAQNCPSITFSPPKECSWGRFPHVMPHHACLIAILCHMHSLIALNARPTD